MSKMDDYILIEKFEELRSRISILCNFSKNLKLNFNSAKNSGLILPYPKGAFEQLDKYIQYLEKKINVIPGDTYEAIIFHLTDLFNKSVLILDYLIGLQTLMEQRVVGNNINKIIEYNSNHQVEYCNMEKVYYAIDSVSYDLMQRMFSKQWIEEKSYVPISSFDQAGYRIFPITYQVVIPYHDIFRLRFWPILSHEMAHLWVYEFINEPINYIKDEIEKDFHFVPDTIPEILKSIEQFNFNVDEIILFFLHSTMEFFGLLRKHNYPEYAVTRPIAQFTEITSDIIATLVCGPCYPLAISSLFPILPGELTKTKNHPYKIDGFLDSSHPFSEARISSSFEILKLQNINQFDDIFNSNLLWFQNKNKKLFSDESSRFMEDYVTFFNKYAENLYEIIISQNKLEPFSEKDIKYLINMSENISDFSKLTPVCLLNLAWLKRINKFKEDYTVLEEYYDKKRNESKTFELIVNQMYNYYTSEIFKEEN